MGRNFARQKTQLTFWAKSYTARKVNDRDVLMLISGFKLYNKLR